MLAFIMNRFMIAKLKAFIARRIVKVLQRKYNLGTQYKQSFTSSHDVKWAEVNEYAELARLVYTDDTKEITDKFKDAYIHEIKDIRYILITDHVKKTFTVSIRGTDNLKNAFQDIKFDKDYSRRLKCKLHSGFHGVAEKIFDDLHPKLQQHLNYDIFITGHSLGGAEAVIIGAYCAFYHLKVKKIITFGQPKVFDRDGVARWGRLPLTRVVNETDIVPLVPPVELLYLFKRYCHFGELVKLCDGQYYCFLETKQAGGAGINSLWLNAAKEDFSFIDIAKELPDHFIDNYIQNILPKLKQGGKEVLWKDREYYIEENNK